MNKPDREELIIYPNRHRLLGALLTSTIFIVLTIGLLKRDELPLFKTMILWSGLLFFGFGIFACGFMLVRNLRRRRPMLQLDAAVLTIFDAEGTPYHISWKQIAGFREISIARQKFILIDIHQPDVLIHAEKSVIRRRLMEYNFKLFGTPFNIAPGNLNFPIKKLLSTLEAYHQKYC